MTVDFSDWLAIGSVAAPLIVVAAAAVQRWAVANHNDRLARLAGAAGRAAGRVRDELNSLPSGADAAAAKARLIADATATMEAQFAASLAKLAAPGGLVEQMIQGEFGKLPGPIQANVAIAATATAPIVTDVLPMKLADVVG